MKKNHNHSKSIKNSDILLMPEISLSRRRFIKAGLISLCGLWIPFPARSFAATPPNGRCIRLYNTHTDEHLDICYRAKGGYLSEAFSSINYILRDHRTGEVKPIEPRLVDFLHTIGCRIGGTPCFHIISGYRSPLTNARLRKKCGGVAKKSRHMLGQAVDIRLPDVQTAELRDIACHLRRGGVGYYAKSDFIHIDIGPVRTW